MEIFHILPKAELLAVRQMQEQKVEAEDPNNSLNFWLSQSNYLPFLSKVAMTIVTTPASSGAAEREFSKAGWLCSGRRNRLTGESLQSEVLLTCNLHILRGRLLA